MARYIIEPPEYLFERIIIRIHKEQRFLLIKRSFLASTFVVSVIFIIGGVDFYSKKYNNDGSSSNTSVVSRELDMSKNNSTGVTNFVSVEYPYNIYGTKIIFSSAIKK